MNRNVNFKSNSSRISHGGLRTKSDTMSPFAYLCNTNNVLRQARFFFDLQCGHDCL